MSAWERKSYVKSPKFGLKSFSINMALDNEITSYRTTEHDAFLYLCCDYTNQQCVRVPSENKQRDRGSFSIYLLWIIAIATVLTYNHVD